MKLRTKFLHMLPLIGLMAVPSLTLAAPLCSSVLRARVIVSPAQMNQALRALARLKMEVDHSFADGVSQGLLSKKQTQKLFQDKWFELISALDGVEAPASLKAKLELEIQALQAKTSLEKTVEKEQRALQAEALVPFKPPSYHLVDHQPYMFFVGRIQYHAPTDSLLLDYGGGLLARRDLQIQEEYIISRDARGPQILKDQKKVLSFSSASSIEIHDIASGKLLSQTQSKSPLKAMLDGALSPNEKIYAIYNADLISVVKAANGQEIETIKKDRLLKFSGNIKNLQFINDESLLVRIDNKNGTDTLVRYDLKSQQSQSQIISGDAAISFSSDGMQIFASSSELVVYASSDLSQFSRVSTPNLQARNGTFIRALPITPYHFIASRDRTPLPYAIIANIALDIHTPISNFGGYYNNTPGGHKTALTDATFSADGKTLIILSSKDVKGTMKYYIDRWALDLD